VVVSHDRDFLTGLTTKVMEFTAEGIKEHLGDVTEFLEKRKLEDFKEIEKKDKIQSSVKKESSSNKEQYEARKKQQKDLRNLKNKIDRLEKQIEKREEVISDLISDFDAKMADKEQFEELSKDPDFFKKYEAEKEALEADNKDWELAVEKLNELNG
jgi:ATP-binding cassette subfamily F protein 3